MIKKCLQISPISQTYTITDSGSISLSWSANNSQSWVTLSSSGGTLAAGYSATITATINNNAYSLCTGTYTDTVSFINNINSSENTTRFVSLQVVAVPTPMINAANVNALPSYGGIRLYWIIRYGVTIVEH